MDIGASLLEWHEIARLYPVTFIVLVISGTTIYAVLKIQRFTLRWLNRHRPEDEET